MINLKQFLFQICFIVICLTILKPDGGYAGRKYTREDILKLREEVREMFNHAYSGYLQNAYPYDELRPLSCDGVDTWGSYSLTLIDALDTLAVMGNYTEFRRVVDIVTSKANFDANINVSVFETNIRIVGGLLSAHLLSQRAGVEVEPGWPCNGPLLRLAEDVAKRLIAAFDTSTGMPYGTVNLRHGVPPGETSVTCTAGVGTFILEFGALSRLTGDPIYEEVALNALYALYHHRSSIGLYGNHIDVLTGRWTAQDSGIGAGVDSYLEYLVKGALLVQRPELMAIFNEGRVAIDKHLKRNDWYLWVSMHKGQVTLPVFQSLEAYWPGVLSLIGDINGGMKSMHNYHQVWKQYGFTPEFYNIAQGHVGTNRESYPLRPELIESTMYLYRATKDPFLLDVGMDILRSIQHSARTKCGYATIKDCRDHSLENRMESFFLAETTKYLYLLFDPDNFIHNDGRQGTVHTLPSGRECILDAGGYIFNTEAHPLDPGALLCCSENFNEPKRYSKKTARGEKFTSFIRDEQKNQVPPRDPNYSHAKQNEEQTAKTDDHSVLADEEPIAQAGQEFLDKLEESGAVDVVKVPTPSDDEVHQINNVINQRKISLNMMQMIESLINSNLEDHLLKTAWSHDLLKELIEVIENTDKILKQDKKNKDNNELPVSNPNVQSSKSKLHAKNMFPNKITEKKNLDYTSETKNTSPTRNSGGKENSLNKITVENIENNITLPEETDKMKYQTEQTISLTSYKSNHDSSNLINGATTESEELNHGKEKKGLFELVIVQQFKTIKDTTLKEADLIQFHLKKCLQILELTKSLVEHTNDYELKSQFYTQRLEIMILATDIKRSVEETSRVLTSKEAEESLEVRQFKRLIELVVDGKTVKNFVDKYKGFMDIARKIIALEKQANDLEQANVKALVQEESTSNTESDLNESEDVISNYANDEFEKNVFQANDWKIDDISFQVDDTERVVPVSKVDGGPLLTDKLRLKTDVALSLLPKSLVSSESPFNPQVLLERIRSNPRYYRNTSWTTQYELLTCLPQPYFTRIMLSGEFFND